MNKITFKNIIIFGVLILLFIPIITSSVLDLKQKKENEANYKKFLEEELARKEAEQKTYLLGKFDPALREDFFLIPVEYTNTVPENKMYLRQEALNAFLQMENAARENGIILKIASATRNFDYQKNIWNNKWSGATLVDGKNLFKSIPDGSERFKKILEYSAVPGTSRHHWGTDIDINDANPGYFNTKEGEKVYQWLSNNAYIFGFCQTYNLKDEKRTAGYNEEKWHWSYLPLGRSFTIDYIKLIKAEEIKGFLGDEYAASQDLINDYVLGINPDCI